MQKVDFPHLQPSVCFICTTASAEAYADTLRENHTLVATPLTGRKYICDGCVSSAADALGLFDAAKERVEAAEARVTEVEKALVAYETVRAAIETIKPLSGGVVAYAPITGEVLNSEPVTNGETFTLVPATDAEGGEAEVPKTEDAVAPKPKKRVSSQEKILTKALADGKDVRSVAEVHAIADGVVDAFLLSQAD